MIDILNSLKTTKDADEKALQELVTLKPEPAVAEYTYPDQPTEFSEGDAAFRAQLQTLKDSFDSPDLADNVLYVMEYIKANPETSKWLLPDDIGLLVQSCQKAYGVILEKKTANKGKKSKSARRNEEVAQLMSDLDLGAFKL